MKKNIFTSLLCLTTLSFFLVSCDKSDDPPAPPTNTELMTKSTWKFQAATAAGIGDISTAPQLACFIDNTITFTSATAGTITEGTTICSPTTAGPFTWNFASNETQLVLSGSLIPGGTGTYTIVSLNETNLVVSQTYNFPPPVLITITFKH